MKRFITLLSAVLLSMVALAQNDRPQIYNMNFDHWSKKGKEWLPYDKDASSSKRVWATANHPLSILGVNGAEPETEHVAVEGEGKKAAKLHSQKVMWAFAAGSVFIGSFVKMINFSGADITWGTPFTGRPESMTGYYHYIPVTIDYAKPPYTSMKGKMDMGQIEVILTDWDEPIHIVTNENKFFDAETDPSVIGYGCITLTRETDGYVKFNIPIKYRDDRTPKMAIIFCCASRYGGNFTGGDGSVLYVDEFRFRY